MSALEEAIARVGHDIHLVRPGLGVANDTYACSVGCNRCALDRAKEEVDRLATAALDVQAHLDELIEAWQRGCISEHDGLGGVRSNRNLAVAINLRAALAPFQPETKP